MLDGRHEAKPTAPKTEQGGYPPISARNSVPTHGGASPPANGIPADRPIRVPNRATLRRILESRYPTSAQLDAFILDSFFDVFRKFSAGMETTERINLLLSQVSPAVVYAKLLHVEAEDSQREDDACAPTQDASDATLHSEPLPDAHPDQAPGEDAAESRPADAAYLVRLVLAPGTSCVDLLAELARRGIPPELADLCPIPILGGFRSLRLHTQELDVCVTAFPCLLTRDGELALSDGLRVPVGAQRRRTALYLPSGRSGPGYLLSVDSEGELTVTLRRRGVSLSFRAQPAMSEVNHV